MDHASTLTLGCACRNPHSVCQTTCLLRVDYTFISLLILHLSKANPIFQKYVPFAGDHRRPSLSSHFKNDGFAQSMNFVVESVTLLQKLCTTCPSVHIIIICITPCYGPLTGNASEGMSQHGLGRPSRKC